MPTHAYSHVALGFCEFSESLAEQSLWRKAKVQRQWPEKYGPGFPLYAAAGDETGPDNKLFYVYRHASGCGDRKLLSSR